MPLLKLLHINGCTSVRDTAMSNLCRHPVLEDIDIGFCPGITRRGRLSHASGDQSDVLCFM